MADPIYWIDTYGMCFNAETQTVDPMVCYDYQKEALQNFEKYRNNIVLKSRQTGFSVITAAYIAWTIMFKSQQRVLILANDLISSVRLLKTVKEFINNTPEFLKPKTILKDNEKYFEFSNGSWVKAVACSPQAGRGESLTLLVIDEAAFIENDEDIKAGALMATSKTKGKTLMISTPKGTSNLYFKTWANSIKKENDYHRQIAHWTQNPTCIKGLEKRINQDTGKEFLWSPWYQEQCERLTNDKVKIAQELDLSFESSKYLAIDSAVISKYKDYTEKVKPICFFDYTQYAQKNDCFVKQETPFLIFKKPRPGAKYIAAVDVARGDGKDYSTIQILDVETLEQVAEFQGKITADKLADVILPVALAYNEAFVVIEINNMGLTTAYYLHKTLEYKNVYKSKSVVEQWTGPRDARWKVDEGDEIPGFQTTTKSRPFLVTSLNKYLNERQVKLNSKRVVAEFDTFVIKENGKAEHEKGANDDLVIALALALYIRDVEWNNIVSYENSYKAMLGAYTHSSVPMDGNSQNEEMTREKAKIDLNKLGVVGTIFNLSSEKEEIRKQDEDTAWLFD